MSLNEWGNGKSGVKRPKWAFVADFAEYAGNFHDEFAAYVTGRADEGFEGRVESLLELARQEIPNSEKLMNDLLSCRHDEKRGFTHQGIAPTPDRDGAYESVAIFLDKQPSDEELALLVARAKNFHNVPKYSRFDHRPQVLRCRLVKEVTSLELIPLE